MNYLPVSHDIRRGNLHVIIFSVLLLCLGSNVACREYYGIRVPPPVTAIPEADKLIKMSNIRSLIECFSVCMTYSECGMIIYSSSDKVCILRKIKQLPGASSFIDIPANSIYTMLQAPTTEYHEFHMGLCEDLSKKVFVWQDGEALTYSHWGPTEPSNYGGIEDCGSLSALLLSLDPSVEPNPGPMDFVPFKYESEIENLCASMCASKTSDSLLRKLKLIVPQSCLTF
ncbi:Hypothetical predicted protein [Octopus vulgaris]|uniref:C-type lectin domain-containing protein n=1 Tax=Octopus vulgaris TaxID=6645 RepID=A0AA36EWR7_OCTVU|nr:Hypothetical predicted protein [Octopus vulgaris]